MTWSPTEDQRILCFNLNTYAETACRDIGPLPGGCQRLVACGHQTVAFYNFRDRVTQNLIIIHNLQ